MSGGPDDGSKPTRPLSYRVVVVGLRIFVVSMVLFLASIFTVVMFGRNVYSFARIAVLAGLVGWVLFAVGYVGIIRSPRTPVAAISNPLWRSYLTSMRREALFWRPIRRRGDTSQSTTE